MNRSRRPQSARRSRQGDGNDGPRGSIWERLNTDSKTLNTRQEAWRKERERRELAACTFKPKIHSSPASAGKKRGGDAAALGTSPASSGPGSGSSSGPRKPVWERLSATNVAAEKLRRDNMKKQQELAECTFQPKLSHHRKGSQDGGAAGSGAAAASTPDGKRKPIWERLYGEKKDQAELERLKAEHELEKCTFSPLLSAETTEMLRGTAGGKPIWDRLYRDAEAERKVREKTRRWACVCWRRVCIWVWVRPDLFSFHYVCVRVRVCVCVCVCVSLLSSSCVFARREQTVRAGPFLPPSASCFHCCLCFSPTAPPLTMHAHARTRTHTHARTRTHNQHAAETAKKKAELELSGCTFSPALKASSQEMIDQL